MFMSLSWIKKYMGLDFWFNLAWMAIANLPLNTSTSFRSTSGKIGSKNWPIKLP